MSHPCQHCEKNDDRVRCPDCEGSGVIGYCIDCEEPMAGDEHERCGECQEIEDDRIESKEFIEALTDPDTDQHDLADRTGSQLNIKPRLIKI